MRIASATRIAFGLTIAMTAITGFALWAENRGVEAERLAVAQQAEFKQLGIDAFYVPLNDIATDQGKIGGAAQKRLANGGMLHHVTMSYDIDADKMVEVLRIGKEKLSDKGTASAKKRVDPLRRQTGLARTEIVSAMMDVFAGRYGATPSELTGAELETARQRVASKFGTHEWLYRVP